MALNFSDRIYSEFSERLQNPYTNFAIQLGLKKKAQQEAVDEYYRKLNDSLNPAGVRYVDMPGFQKRVEALKTYTIQNKDLLRRGDIPTQLERDRLFRDAQKFIEGSKDAATGQKEAAGLMEKFRGEDKNLEPLFPHIQANELPLEAEGFQRFNPNQFLMEAKPFDENAYFQKFDKTPRVSTFEMGKVDPKTGYRIDTEIKEFTPEVKQGLATQFAQDFHNKASFNDRVNDLIKDPREKENLTVFFNEQFGRAPETKEDFAAAYGLRRLQPRITQQGKPVLDQIFLANLRQAQAKQLKEFEKQLDGMTETAKNTWLQDWLVDQVDKATITGVYNVGNGRTISGKEIPVSAFIAKSFSKGGETPDKFIASEGVIIDNAGNRVPKLQFTPIFYKRDNDGYILNTKGQKLKDKGGEPDANETLTVTQDINSAVVDMGGQVGVKQKNVEGAALVGKKPETTKKTVSVSTKSSSKPAGAKKEIKRSDIPAKAKASGYSTEEYEKLLKENGVNIIE
jgi:hypothetical protein